LKQYPRIGFLINLIGGLKTLFHGLMRHDISLMPRPLDGWLAALTVRRKIPKEPHPPPPDYAYRHALPVRNTPTEAREHAAAAV
jgi:hypothetical protein